MTPKHVELRDDGETGKVSEELLLSSLHPDPRNARKHGERNLALIESALKEVGAARSVVVDEDGVVLAGNATLAAAISAGLTHVRIVETDGRELVAVRRSGLSEAQKRKLALYDNRAAELADWDEEILAGLAEERDLSILWEPDELADLLGQDEPVPVDPLADPDEVPEPPEAPVTQPGDLWLLGHHRVLCGDATNADDVRLLMQGERAVVMPTDPPYLVNYRGGNHPQSWSNTPAVKDKHWDDYQEGDGPAFFARFRQVALSEALVPNPAIYQFHASARQALVEQAWRENGLRVHQQLIWVKSRPVLTHSHNLWQHQPCFYGWVQGKQPGKRPPPTATTVWRIDKASETTDVLEAKDDPSSGLHPTQKPVELIRRMIEHHATSGELVYEPFGGSGTALIASELSGRTCRALELAPAYCDVIVKRWENVTGRTAERIAAAPTAS